MTPRGYINNTCTQDAKHTFWNDSPKIYIKDIRMIIHRMWIITRWANHYKLWVQLIQSFIFEIQENYSKMNSISGSMTRCPGILMHSHTRTHRQNQNKPSLKYDLDYFSEANNEAENESKNPNMETNSIFQKHQWNIVKLTFCLMATHGAQTREVSLILSQVRAPKGWLLKVKSQNDRVIWKQTSPLQRAKGKLS